MDRSGINCHQQLRAANQSRQRKEICLSSEVDESLPGSLCNFCDVRLLVG
jgi:hypothetical protein